MQARLEPENIALFSPPRQDKGFPSSNKRKPSIRAIHSIYSIQTLHELFIEQNRGREETDLRFLVDMSGFLWFARETHDAPAPPAPPHCKLCGDDKCRTAGNLFFNEKRDTLVKINHKSGDYRPTYESINWLLAILVLNEELLPFRLPEILQIDRINDVGGFEETNHITLASIRTWVETLDAGLTRTLLNQPSVTKKVEVSPPERPYRELNQSEDAVVNRSLFGGMGMFATNTGSGSESEEDVARYMNKGRKHPRLLYSLARSPSP